MESPDTKGFGINFLKLLIFKKTIVLLSLQREKRVKHRSSRCIARV